jgi:hypothetical protein
VKQRQVHLFIRQDGQQLAECAQNGQAGAPAVAVAGTEQGGLAHHVGRRLTGGEQAMHGLGNDQAEIMGQPVLEPLAPMPDRIDRAEHGLDPNLAARTNLDRAGRHIVRPEIECAAACHREARVMPVAGQDAVGDAATIEREAHMRAAVVEGEHAPVRVHEEDRAMRTMHDEPPLGLHLLQSAHAHEIRKH